MTLAMHQVVTVFYISLLRHMTEEGMTCLPFQKSRGLKCVRHIYFPTKQKQMYQSLKVIRPAPLGLQ